MQKHDVEMVEQRQILIVDDQREICDLLRGFLLFDGFQLECAKGGADARAALQNGKFDLGPVLN